MCSQSVQQTTGKSKLLEPRILLVIMALDWTQFHPTAGPRYDTYSQNNLLILVPKPLLIHQFDL